MIHRHPNARHVPPGFEKHRSNTEDVELACSENPQLFDLIADAEGLGSKEQEEQRLARYAKARALCRRCPLLLSCAEDAAAEQADGIRGGLLWETGERIPDPKPGGRPKKEVA